MTGAIATGTAFLTGWRAEQWRRDHAVTCVNTIQTDAGPITNGGEAPHVPTPEPETTPDFASMTREQLREQAKRLGIVGQGRMLKGDLLAIVAETYAKAA